MNTFKDWLQFINASYIRCGFVVAFIVMQWLIIEPFDNASIIFVITMSFVGILATKIIFDKETEIEKFKERLSENNISYTDISGNDEN